MGEGWERTAVCQPAMFLAGAAGLEKLREDIREDAVERPGCVAGLSLGEYTALKQGRARCFLWLGSSKRSSTVCARSVQRAGKFARSPTCSSRRAFRALAPSKPL